MGEMLSALKLPETLSRHARPRQISPHHQQASTSYSVLPLFVERWSPRSFADRPVEREKLVSLFEAARLAPSAHNTQPARFIVGQKGFGPTYEQLFRCLSEGNQRWAHSAPVLILASVMNFRFSQRDAALVPYPHCTHDLGLAVMSLILQAQSLELFCHPLAGFEPDQARVEFNIPPLFEPMVVIAVGYLGSPDALPDDLREREVVRRPRRPLSDLVFAETWGQSWSLLDPDATHPS